MPSGLVYSSKPSATLRPLFPICGQLPVTSSTGIVLTCTHAGQPPNPAAYLSLAPHLQLQGHARSLLAADLLQVGVRVAQAQAGLHVGVWVDLGLEGQQFLLLQQLLQAQLLLQAPSCTTSDTLLLSAAGAVEDG